MSYDDDGVVGALVAWVEQGSRLHQGCQTDFNTGFVLLHSKCLQLALGLGLHDVREQVRVVGASKRPLKLIDLIAAQCQYMRNI